LLSLLACGITLASMTKILEEITSSYQQASVGGEASPEKGLERIFCMGGVER